MNVVVVAACKSNFQHTSSSFVIPFRISYNCILIRKWIYLYVLSRDHTYQIFIEEISKNNRFQSFKTLFERGREKVWSRDWMDFLFPSPTSRFLLILYQSLDATYQCSATIIAAAVTTATSEVIAAVVIAVITIVSVATMAVTTVTA